VNSENISSFLRDVRNDMISGKSSRIFFRNTVQNVQYIVILKEFKNQGWEINDWSIFCVV
jgi:hypothetical protein